MRAPLTAAILTSVTTLSWVPVAFARRRLLLRWRGLLRRGRSARRRLHDGTGLRAALAVEPPVVLGGAEDPLHVVLRLGERNVVDELVFVEAGALRLPADDAALAGVVAGQRVVGAAELLDQLARNTACRAGG